MNFKQRSSNNREYLERDIFSNISSTNITDMHFRPVPFQMNFLLNHCLQHSFMNISLIHIIHHGVVMLSRGEMLFFGSVKSGQRKSSEQRN